MIKKILALVFVIITGLVAVSLLKRKVATQLQEKLGANFYYSFEDMSVNLINRELTLTQLSFAYPKDSSKFEYIGEAASFSVKGFDIFALLFSKSLSLGTISLEVPTLTTNILQKRNATPILDSLPLEDLNFYAFIEGALDELSLEQFIATNGKFDWYNAKNDSLWRTIEGIDLSIKDFELDSTIAADNNGWFRLSDVTLEVEHYMERLPDSIHTISSDAVSFSYAEQFITAKNISMRPIYSRKELANRLSYQKDILTLNANSLSMREIDMDRLIYDEELYVGNALLDGATLSVFKDKSLAFPHVYKVLPIKKLKDIAFDITINETTVKNAAVFYEQQNAAGEKTGELAFNEINAAIKNLTSSETQMLKNGHTLLEADALLHGKGKISLSVDFDLNDTTGGHQVKGSISAFSLTDLNKIIVPLAFIKIKSGNTQGLDFHFYANNDGTKGEMNFRYTDLSVELLDRASYLSGSEETKWFGTALLNGLVVRKENPMGSLLRMGNIESDRNTEKSLFNLWWKGIASGMSSTMINFKKDAREVNSSISK